MRDWIIEMLKIYTEKENDAIDEKVKNYYAGKKDAMKMVLLHYSRR